MFHNSSMKSALAMMVKDERDMLARILPIHVRCFDHRFAIDTGSSDDSVELLKKYGFEVRHSRWESDFGKVRNALIDFIHAKGFEWAIMMDADEVMWPDEAKQLQRYLETSVASVVYQPRFNIAGNYDRWWKPETKDLQGKVIRTGRGVRFSKKVHEVASINGSPVPANNGGAGETVEYPIYHYGMCKSLQDIRRRQLYYLSIAGLLPESVKDEPLDRFDFEKLPRFTRPHPLHA